MFVNKIPASKFKGYKTEVERRGENMERKGVAGPEL
jgi:hypothetical protein